MEDFELSPEQVKALGWIVTVGLGLFINALLILAAILIYRWML